MELCDLIPLQIRLVNYIFITIVPSNSGYSIDKLNEYRVPSTQIELHNWKVVYTLNGARTINIAIQN